MILTFKDKKLKRLFESGKARGVQPYLVPRLIRRLDAIHAARAIADVNLPGYRLHQLKGARRGEWSITVSGNWRLTFAFHDGDAYDVLLEDYH